MNAQMLLENFELIANAPGGVKRLREMILQLAVTGTLTEREQNDTQADVLFRRNQEHRDRLIEKKELHIQKPLPPIDNASVPWILPDTWKWCRLGQVTSYGSTDKAEYLDVNSETWVLELEDIEKETSRLLSKIRAKDRKFLSSKNKFVRGQVLYGKLRPYLDKVVIADEGGVCTTEIIPILPFAGILSEYLRWYLKCPFFKSYANNSTHGMNLPRLGTEPARLALFAFPPVEEQQRIVAKVDELMALCDKLETQQQERERHFPVLSRACHARFVESPSLDNLKAIFDEAGSISTDELRKTVLDLAVQGKLNTQNSYDEPACFLLKRIEDEKRKYIDSGLIKNDRASFSSALNEPYKLPKSWQWVELKDIFIVITDGDHQPPPKSSSGIPFLVISNVRSGVLDFSDNRYVTADYYNSLDPIRRPELGDILYTLVGSYGISVLVADERRFCVQRHIGILKPSKQISAKFVAKMLSTQLIFEQATTYATGIAQKTVVVLQIVVNPHAVATDRDLL